jgi:putative endonuclease
MPSYVYVIKSEVTGTCLIGSTPNLKKTLEDHNSGKILSTMSKRPWKLIYKEEYENLSDAATREKYYQSEQGTEELRAKGIV